ncbi:MAG TPA: hypothetical protein VIG33_05425 [Pseudobdellovibrionaceae bacterium]|jgi:hypothetical protein
MSLDKAMKNLKFDKRLTEWYINNGQLTKEELEAHLKTLPDMGHNVELADSQDEADESDEEEFSQH